LFCFFINPLFLLFLSFFFFYFLNPLLTQPCYLILFTYPTLTTLFY
jgi:hypothetical protein